MDKTNSEKLNALRKEYENMQMNSEQIESLKSVIEDAKQEKGRERHKVMMRRCSTAAAVAAAFLVVLNTSPVVANAMENIPVLGSVARILTFRTYVQENDDLSISVDIPGVEMISEDTNGLTDAVNQEIYELCEQYSREAIARAEEYKKAFLETGGTQEEWEAHNIAIKVDYAILSQTDDYLSFTVTGSENWNSGCNETRYYNLDLREEKLVTLEDLLGEDYVNIVNADIQTQMKQRTATGEVFFDPGEGGFTGIDDAVKFYINQAGNPVIVFDKYEVAPGSAGMVEFEIDR